MEYTTGSIVVIDIENKYKKSQVVPEFELKDGDFWIKDTSNLAYLVVPNEDKLVYIMRKSDTNTIWEVLGVYPCRDNCRILNNWASNPATGWKFYKKSHVKKVYIKELE